MVSIRLLGVWIKSGGSYMRLIRGEGLSCGYYKAAPAADVVGEYYEGSQHEFLENIISSLSKEALLPSAKSVV